MQFLLKPIKLPDTPVYVKEALIQSGKKHYSEMLTHESLPPDDYLPLFYRAMTLNQDRMAEHLLLLAEGYFGYASAWHYPGVISACGNAGGRAAEACFKSAFQNPG